MLAYFTSQNGRSRIERRKLLHETCNSCNFFDLIDHGNNNCPFYWYHSILSIMRSYFEVLPILSCLHGAIFVGNKGLDSLIISMFFFYFNNILNGKQISHLSFFLFLFIASCCSVALFRLLHLLEFPANEPCGSPYFVILVTFSAMSIKICGFNGNSSKYAVNP